MEQEPVSKSVVCGVDKGGKDWTSITLWTRASGPEEILEDAGEIVRRFDAYVTATENDRLRRHEFELVRQFLLWMYHGAPSPEQPTD